MGLLTRLLVKEKTQESKIKIHIGPYTDWIGPYQIADKIFFWVNRNGIYVDEPAIFNRWDYRACDKFGDWLSNTWISNLCEWIESKKKRKIKIRIDSYDTWSMDHTLALIIHPMLLQLKNTTHGSPYVDDIDVPEYLRSYSAPMLTQEQKDIEYTDANHHKRWEWVLEEIIWTFNQIIDESADDHFHSGKHDIYWQKVDLEGNPIGDPVAHDKKEKILDEEKKCLYQIVKGPEDTHVFDSQGYKEWCERKRNGFKLFGKYYQDLWD